MMMRLPGVVILISFAIPSLAQTPVQTRAVLDSLSERRPDLYSSHPPHPKGYVCRHASSPLTIDGRLDEADWARAAWTDDFIDIQGSGQPVARFRTRVKMLWDDEYFFIGAEVSDPHIWATLLKRDTVIFYDNDFEVFIDPNGDNHEYYEFEMNALNTVWDLFLPIPYRDGGGAVDSWNIEGLRTAVHVAGTLNDPRDIDTCWSVEIAMPWTSLAAYAHKQSPPGEGDQWRVNFSRVEWTTSVEGGNYVKVKGLSEDNWVWSPQWVIDMHRPEFWGYVQFTRTSGEVAAVVPDPTWNVRIALLRVYYAQKSFYEDHKRWAGTLQELSNYPVAPPVGVDSPVIRLNDSGYVCSVRLDIRGGKGETWNISQDSRLWRSEKQ